MICLRLAAVAGLVVAVGVGSLGVKSVGRPPAAAAAAKPVANVVVRVGVYDSRAIAVAYSRSAGWNDVLTEKMKEREAAQAAGDKKKVADLEAWGRSRQTMAHLAVFSGVPMDDALLNEKVAAGMKEVGAKRGLSAIVRRTEWVAAGVEVVDVTDDLVDLFDPDDRVLKIVEGLKGQKLIDPATVLGMKE